MISRNSRNGAIALSLLLAISIWAGHRSQDSDNAPTAGLDLRLDYALSNFEFRWFDAEGQPAILLTSPRFTSDTASGEGLAIDPVLDVNYEGAQWNIIADSATVSNDREIIRLSGDVHLLRIAQSPSGPMTVDSSNVTLEITPRIARSGQYVEVKDASSRLTATGFSVDMKNNNYQLMSDVKGSYVLQ
jgi:LPS export ABC transporter protein LptC